MLFSLINSVDLLLICRFIVNSNFLMYRFIWGCLKSDRDCKHKFQMFEKFVLLFSTVSYLYTIAISLLQFYVIAREQVSPNFTLKWDVTNASFGVATSISIVIFLCFLILLNRLIYSDNPNFFTIDKDPATKCTLTVFISLITIFYCGLYGFISFVLLFISAILNLIADKIKPTYDEEFDVELADLGPRL